MKLTDTIVHRLMLPAGVADKVFFDDDLPGFGVRIRSSGARRWMVQYDAPGGRTRRMMLGRTSAFSAAKARTMARDILASVRTGQDPAADKATKRLEAAETIGAILPSYLALKRAELKPRSFEAVERHLTEYAKALHPRPIRAVDLREAARLLEKVGASAGMATRNRARSSLAALYSWACGEGLVEANPFAFTNKAPENGARKRTPTLEELAEIWRAAGDGHYGQLVRLLILTGARRAEIANLRWSEVDPVTGWITISAERTKNGSAHEIPITGPVANILESCRQAHHPGRDLVLGRRKGGFQHFSTSKSELDERINAARAAYGVGPMPAWVLHDFRRALSTLMHQRLGVAPHIVEACLGHVGVFKAGVAGVYNTAMYREQRRDALERWADLLMAAIASKTKTAGKALHLAK